MNYFPVKQYILLCMHISWQIVASERWLYNCFGALLYIQLFYVPTSVYVTIKRYAGLYGTILHIAR